MGKTLSKTNCCVVDQISSSLTISAEAEKYAFFKDDEPILEMEEGVSENVDPEVSFKFVTNFIQSSNEIQEWPAILSVTCEDQDIDLRGGLDLIVLLETSSPNRCKDRVLRNSVEFLMSRLTGQDRLSLISFNSSSHRLTPLLSMTYTSKVRINLLLQSLQYSPGLDLLDSLYTAYSVLSNRRLKNKSSHIIILGSGEDSSNENIKERLSPILQEFINQDIQLWLFSFYPSHIFTFISEESGGCHFVAKSEKSWFYNLAYASGLVESTNLTQVSAQVQVCSPNVQISKVYSENGELSFRMKNGLFGRTSSVVLLIKILPVRMQGLVQLVSGRVEFSVNGIRKSADVVLSVQFVDAQINEIELDEVVMQGFYRAKAADVLYEAAYLALGTSENAKLLLEKAIKELEESCINNNSLVLELTEEMKKIIRDLKNSSDCNLSLRNLARSHWLELSSEIENYQSKATKMNRFRLKTLFNIV